MRTLSPLGEKAQATFIPSPRAGEGQSLPRT
jgi:hypothetical protein